MNRKGFTLLELLVTIGIIVVLSAVMFMNNSGKRSSTEFAAATQQVATLLREAQSRTLAGDQNGTTGNGFWGVSLVNATTTSPSYSLFYATSTAALASASVVSRYTLPSAITYTTSSIASGGTLYVYYSSGLTSGGTPGVSSSCVGYTCPVGTTTIIIGLIAPKRSPVASSTLSIVPTGGVSY